MELTDFELDVLYNKWYDYTYYGDDSIVYGHSPEAEAVRSIMGKIEDEAKHRGG